MAAARAMGLRLTGSASLNLSAAAAATRAVPNNKALRPAAFTLGYASAAQSKAAVASTPVFSDFVWSSGFVKQYVKGTVSGSPFTHRQQPSRTVSGVFRMA